MTTYRKDHRKYYEKNREEIIERSRQYKNDNIPLYRRDHRSNLRMLLGKAKLRKKEVSIVPEDLYRLWDLQNGLCAYSGMPLCIEANQLETMSLDRINSSIGYVNGNVQLVCAIVNRMKQEFSEIDFLRYCALITNKTKITYSD